MERLHSAIAALFLLAAPREAGAAILVNPTGVNVESQGATTVYLTFGGLRPDQYPVEAFWCGELVSAAPGVGSKCDSTTLFGQLPLRYDLSSQTGNIFTDIMSVPPSVARRAYLAAAQGRVASFFYVRRFASHLGMPDEYVAVTCRSTAGGAATPLSLTDVQYVLDATTPAPIVRVGQRLPPVSAELRYTGTGRLIGRWEVVLPGETPPEDEDLLPEGSLPPERRGTQRRYTQLGRFDVQLDPGGKFTLPGPSLDRIPTSQPGTYRLLLRIEASDEKEADSNPAAAGASGALIHSGGAAGFPLPVLRYQVVTPWDPLESTCRHASLSIL